MFHPSARGKMTVRKHPDDHQASFKHVLPPADDDVCRDVNRTHTCYLAGIYDLFTVTFIHFIKDEN